MQFSVSSAGMSHPDLIQTLVDSFNALADEVQNLNDRKTILEHKLRFAHEQFQYLADKYAPAAPEIEETLAKLQLPPELHNPALEHISFVPLPNRIQYDSQHKIALLVREGRKVAERLAAISDPRQDTGSSRAHTSPTTLTSMTTAMEQDFTVQGQKGKLECPFQANHSLVDASEAPNNDHNNVHDDNENPAEVSGAQDPTPHHSADPICAAMYEETMSSTPPTNASNGANKCPIRYMDQHSPEEIAQYVEKHKHEIPRSHEVCVRRYQRNEDQIRKLDAKYGSLATMIQDLSHLHQPMLPLDAQGNSQGQEEVDRASNQRVENWAQDVSASPPEDPEKKAQPSVEDTNLERESHFDRPLKEVRVGESPSRPWGISVPIYDISSTRGLGKERPVSPPPAPVMMPSSPTPTVENGEGARKCPFGHIKHSPTRDDTMNPHLPKMDDKSSIRIGKRPDAQQPFSPIYGHRTASPPPQPTFINPQVEIKSPANPSQMVFTGPVFIGYPMEQAIQFMQEFRQNR
ncbi:hypothetical protein MKZ38_007327 [Zalerion maritima]|uniref:Uncharacterized protein n=1 Tax=Zalerion maritima TaxID=339359 RepID=A0AAD5WVI6_9PEZI|nr:hypothetical protein MKZ38_007327 [Zalerion maritima]